MQLLPLVAVGAEPYLTEDNSVIKEGSMLKKAICTLLLSGMPFVANMALAVEGQFSEFSDSSLVSDNTAPIVS